MILKIVMTFGAIVFFVAFVAFIWGLLFGPSIFERRDID